MRVSVLVTNYNHGHYLAAAIDSAANQSVKAAEIVVVDDGSTDDSRSIISELVSRYGEQLIPVLKANGGQADAINEGFKCCTGDVIAMLDADDLFEHTKIEMLAVEFAANPTVSMVQHPMKLIDGKGEGVGETTAASLPQGNVALQMRRTGGCWMFSPTSGLAFSRSSLEQILPLPTQDWRLCADGALCYAASFLGPVRVIDRRLGSYRLHQSNHFHKKPKDFARLTADLEMSNRYINSWAKRSGNGEHIDLNHNLNYRREKFYQQGGSVREAAAILGLIARWPLYNHLDRAKFAARFMARAAATWARGSGRTATSSM